jgi:hypothetical protein
MKLFQEIRAAYRRIYTKTEKAKIEKQRKSKASSGRSDKIGGYYDSCYHLQRIYPRKAG